MRSTLAVEPLSQPHYDAIVSSTHKHKPKQKQSGSASLNKRLWDFEINHLAVPWGFPGRFNFMFSCKKCFNTIPIEHEEIVMKASSIDEAFRNFNAFAKTLDPRTCKCQCGHKDVYHHEDIILVPVDDQPGVRRLKD